MTQDPLLRVRFMQRSLPDLCAPGHAARNLDVAAAGCPGLVLPPVTDRAGRVGQLGYVSDRESGMRHCIGFVAIFSALTLKEQVPPAWFVTSVPEVIAVPLTYRMLTDRFGLFVPNPSE
jgi:hypothetical protein